MEQQELLIISFHRNKNIPIITQYALTDALSSKAIFCCKYLTAHNNLQIESSGQCHCNMHEEGCNKSEIMPILSNYIQIFLCSSVDNTNIQYLTNKTFNTK